VFPKKNSKQPKDVPVKPIKGIKVPVPEKINISFKDPMPKPFNPAMKSNWHGSKQNQI